MKTKEIMSVEIYKKRCELEDHDGVARGTYCDWTADHIEQMYYNEFQSEVECAEDEDN